LTLSKAFTLSASGKITGNIYTNLTQVSCSATFAGVSVSANNLKSYQGEHQHPYALAVSGPGLSGSANVSYGDVQGGVPIGTAFDVSGSWNIQVPVEEWVDVGGGGNSTPFDLPLASVRIYLAPVPGATMSASISSGGGTAQAIGIVQGDGGASGGGVSLGIHLEAGGYSYGGPNSIPNPYNPHYLSKQLPIDISITGSGNNVNAAGSLTFSQWGPGTDGAQTDPTAPAATGTVSTASGASVNLTPTAVIGTDYPYGYSIRGAASATLYPPRAFSLSGQINSLDQPYPGTVDVYCSKFGGDPDPLIHAGGGSFSASYSQRLFNEAVGGSLDNAKGDNIGGASAGVNEWQSLSCGVSGQWCADNDEIYATQEQVDAGGTFEKVVYDSQIAMLAWQFPGLSLSQAQSITVDACRSATGWTGVALGGGGLQTTGASATRTFYVSRPKGQDSDPPFYLSGYRYLTLAGVSVDSGSHPLTFTIAAGDGSSKSWTRTVTATPTDIVLDLCRPDGSNVTTDTQDTRWPVSDPRSTYTEAEGVAGQGDGPTWGVTSALSFSLTNLAAGRTYTMQGITQARQGNTTLTALPTYGPDFGEFIVERPGQDFSGASDPGSGATAELRCRRGMVALTDGRQSLEFRDLRWIRITSPTAGIQDQARYLSLAEAAGEISAGHLTPAAYTATSDPGNVSPGWQCTTSAPDTQGNTPQTLYGDYLTKDRPATFAGGGGMTWSQSAGFQTYIGLDAAAGVSLPGQVLISSVDWYPGCGDVFGLGGGGSGGKDNPLIVGAQKIYRGQAHGFLVDQKGQPVPNQPVTLTGVGGPEGGVQVGSGRSDAQGVYRTTGVGLTGYVTTGTAPDRASSNAQGIVASGSKHAAQTFRTRHISRAALVAPSSPSCCDQLFFQAPELFNPLAAQAGDQDILPQEEWRK